MTAARQARWQAYLRSLADLLGLRDWRVELEDEPCDSQTAAACVRCIYGQKHAYVRLGRGFDDESPGLQRHYLVHECLHLHLRLLDDVMVNVGNRLAPDTYSALRDTFDDAEEVAIDGIGWAVSQFLPLPPAFVETTGETPDPVAA